MKRHFTIALWMPVRLSATTPESLNGCGGPWCDVSRRSLNLLEDILSIYYKCTLSDITHKLNVSGHTLIWTFFHVLVCGTRAQRLPAPFNYTLYNQLWLVKVSFQLLIFSVIDPIFMSCNCTLPLVNQCLMPTHGNRSRNHFRPLTHSRANSTDDPRNLPSFL
jgi:hypothetical protein